MYWCFFCEDIYVNAMGNVIGVWMSMIVCVVVLHSLFLILGLRKNALERNGIFSVGRLIIYRSHALKST